ncbi:uncharacterized protein LOC144886560 [Branchiostoma floridae x Branchiostoma japonicum]
MSDPVFVNPNSAASMRRVLRHVGQISNIHRYSNMPNSRRWLVVAMDGLPMGITRNVIRDTLYCTNCKLSFDSNKSFHLHVTEQHPDSPVTEVKEFDWVILRVGKLHLEMNALKSFVDLNFDVWFGALAEEMGFKSESAQKVARNCADHHKSMELLEIALKGGIDEMLVPYVRQKLQAGEQDSISADDFLFKWVIAVRNKNFLFFQQQISHYAIGIKNFHVGTRRNNTKYVQAGIEVFSPLFSGRNHPKYQLIDMFDGMDRAMYPPDLKSFMEKTESVTGGNRSLGEGMDAKLEEKNKASKAWHKGAPVASDWVRVFRNLDKLEKLRDRFFDIIGVADGSSQAYNRYSQEPEVDAWRTRLRAEKYLHDPFNKKAEHVSMSGKPLTTNLLDFDRIARRNKERVFEEVLLLGKPRADVKQDIVHVTEEDRCRAEDISRQYKPVIIQRIKEMLSRFVVEDVKSYYEETLSKTVRKEDLLLLYHEVDNELTEQENVKSAVEQDVLASAANV